MEWELLPPPGAQRSGASSSAGGGILGDPEDPAAVIEDLAPPWLHVAPTAGALQPGESARIALSVGVGAGGAMQLADPSTAERLAAANGGTAGPCPLSHALVLRVIGGADHFIVVDGAFAPSFLGLSVGTLAMRQAAAEVDGSRGGTAAAVHTPRFEAAAATHSVAQERPYAAGQWAKVPAPLQALLHFLAGCAPVDSNNTGGDQPRCSFSFVLAHCACSCVFGLLRQGVCAA